MVDSGFAPFFYPLIGIGGELELPFFRVVESMMVFLVVVVW
jgi:hypothetical protein